MSGHHKVFSKSKITTGYQQVVEKVDHRFGSVVEKVKSNICEEDEEDIYGEQRQSFSIPERNSIVKASYLTP
jgi:hypothetical protein